MGREITSSTQIRGKYLLPFPNGPSLVPEAEKSRSPTWASGWVSEFHVLLPPGSRKPFMRVDTRESLFPTSHFSSVPTKDKDLFVSVCMLQKMNEDLITAAHFLKGSPIYDVPYVLPAAIPLRAGVLSDLLR